jgi:hypothetical protein
MFIQQQVLRQGEHADEIAVLGEILDRLRSKDVDSATAFCMARLVQLEAKSQPKLAAFNSREEEPRC